MKKIKDFGEKFKDILRSSGLRRRHLKIYVLSIASILLLSWGGLFFYYRSRNNQIRKRQEETRQVDSFTITGVYKKPLTNDFIIPDPYSFRYFYETYYPKREAVKSWTLDEIKKFWIPPAPKKELLELLSRKNKEFLLKRFNETEQ